MKIEDDFIEEVSQSLETTKLKDEKISQKKQET